MSADINKKYFRMSFKFDKSKPEDFGLIQSNQNADIYIDANDNSEWERKALYDFGWGNENGFVRLPQLDFVTLWHLLQNSELQENIYGAAYIIESEFSDALKNYLLNYLNDSNMKVTEPLKKAFKVLRLEKIENRSDVVGKSYNEIKRDFEDWERISSITNDILNH